MATPDLVHVCDPERAVEVDGIDRLAPTATAAAMAPQLERAPLLVVDDALGFPFEALRDVDLDLPMAVRVPRLHEADAVEATLGADLFDHLTPFDVVAGFGSALGPVLDRRHLPRTRYVGEADLTLEQLVNRGRQWRRRNDEEWRNQPTPAGAPIDVVPFGFGVEPGPRRLRQVKARFRVERDLLRSQLAHVATELGRTRAPAVGLVARRPAAWASAMPPRIASWTAVSLVPGDDPSPDLERAGVAHLVVPPHVRLALGSEELDVVVVVGDLMHSPAHAVRRLLSECLRALRPAGFLVLCSEVVPDPRREADRRPRPLWTSDLVELVATAGARQVLLEDVRAFARPDEDHHRGAVFRWRRLGSAGEVASWM